MTHATRLVHNLAGKPPVEGASAKAFTSTAPTICCVCGETENNTAPAKKVLGENFTDRGMFTREDSDRACWACVAICSGKPPRSFRQWTVIATPGRELPPSQEKAAAWIGQHNGLCLTSKKDTTPVIDTLWDPPAGQWLVSVADSGQKHVLPYATVCEGNSGVIRFETINVPYRCDDWRQVFTATLGLRRLGIPSDAILTGTPKYLKTREMLTQWQKLDGELAAWHRSPLLRLALWTITKGITENDNYPHA
ncbi:hypothetical protein FYJ24_06945 [Actinomycetaceae bacterium WB03_NA08]|uniref:Uncharacterized protein n=1 Tax=Scrofimicrobium canadense TaxID=2652290 RepID=A0A6N7VRU9_9ACTO|nr:hypothetical protein [Scrofimicrobium canadense]MSS84504.1 hypothetical protein [Scrofimicrobium canadense]